MPDTDGGPALVIGVSACLMPPDAARRSAPSKTLQFIEQTTAQWLMEGGALPLMIPAPPEDGGLPPELFAHYARALDGLVLHGGADVWPGHYGEEPLDAAWQGDARRDRFEMALLAAFAAAGKPVFGICRGLQLINVAFGGSLVQDIGTQLDTERVHRDAALYDANLHGVELVPGTRLETLLAGLVGPATRINSIHHQAIARLAAGFVVEARCPDDGIIEAIRLNDEGCAWIAAVQWHPEFHRPQPGLPADALLDDRPLRDDFLAAARAARSFP